MTLPQYGIISDGALETARFLLAGGSTLAFAAEAIGTDCLTLDKALWSSLLRRAGAR